LWYEPPVLSTLLSVLLAANLVSIEGAGSCPSADDIRERLEALQPDGAASTLHVRLVAVDGATELEIDGSPPLRRRLPADASCADQALIAATVIATWQSQLDTVPAAPSPARSRAPSPSQSPVPPTVTAPAPSPPAVIVSAPATPPTAVRSRVTVEVNAAWLGAIGPGGFAPGIILEPRLSVRGWPVGFFVGGFFEATRTLDLGGGNVDFGRAALLLGAGYRLERGRWSLDLRAQALAALLYLSGHGFTQNYDRLDGDFGLGAGARGGVRLGRVRPFIGVDAVGWLRSIQAQALEAGSTVATELPRFEVQLSVGLTLFKP
jgi:hypothetical protein